MRKLFFLFAFLGIVVVVFHSCKKDKDQNLENEENSLLDVMTQEDIQIRDKILNFRDNVGKHLKSDESIEVESAIWNMEATINYTYSWDDFDYVNLPNDSLFYDVSLTQDGQILLSDVDSIYALIISDLRVIFNSIDADVKHMIYNNIEEFGNDRDAFSTSIIVTTRFGISPLFTYGSFEDGEDWMYGDDLGMCNDQTTGSDAAEEIEYKLNNPENPPTPPPGGSYYFTDLDLLQELWPEDWPNPNDETENDNIFDYMVFINYHNGWMPNYHECLPHNEMNFYLAGTANVLNSYYPDGLRPSGLTFKSIDLVGSMYTSMPDYFIFHQSEYHGLVYGVKHLTIEPPKDL